MKRLIDNSDFDGKVYKVFADGENATIYLNEIISEVQEDVLRKILGFSAYNEMENSQQDDGTFDLQKWTDFVDGKSYEYNGDTYNYRGIKKVLTLFVYEKWQRFSFSVLAETGELVNQFKNATPVFPRKKVVDAHNLAVRLIQEVDESVYNFLTHNNYDFKFTQFEKINMLGI